VTASSRVEPAGPADVDAIDEISRHSFRTPWPRRMFEEELGRPHGRLDVARGEAGAVIGYVNYWIVVDEVHLLAVATHPDARRAGVGAALMERVMAAARAAGARLITLEVRAGNLPARRLYERFGFAVISVRRGYYGEDGEDAVVMTRELTSP
jgi:ribosomal-protein-alanine N-acetyltransferase